MAKTNNQKNQDYHIGENIEQEINNVKEIDVQDYYIDEKKEDETAELEKILKKTQELCEQIKKGDDEKFNIELKQHVEDVQNNLGIFSAWIKGRKSFDNLYKDFGRDFSCDYRSQLFENIYEFFNDSSFVTNEILFQWKHIVVSLIKSHKKYKYCLDNLFFDKDTQDTNFKLVKEKYIFKCFLGEEQICYFKENGNDYYVS